MNKLHFLSLLFNQPQLCTPEYAETVTKVLSEKYPIDAEGLSIHSEESEDRGPDIRGDGTLVIPILGSMVNRAGFLDAMSGVQSYGAIQAQIQEALDNPSVKSILLEMDSPGGTVAGAFDLRDFIMSVRGQKPIVAIATDTMASAAYLIGSACDKVYTTQTGEVGSIGVVAVHMDQSEYDKAMGVKPTFIYAGDYKVAGNPHEPLEGEALNYLQESVNDSYEMFVSAVAEARGLEASKVKGTQARMYRGEKAVKMGLSDGVMTLDNALRELADSAKRVQISMSVKQEGLKMDKEELETMQADLAKLSQENEALRGVVISEGYKITANGIEKAEADVAPEYMEIAGEKIDINTLPKAVVDQLKADAEQKADAALSAKAKEQLPNFSLEVAKEIVKAGLSEATMTALKAADNTFKMAVEETGEADVDGDMTDATTALEAKLAEVASTKGINKTQAFAELSKTAEGRKLIQEAYYGDKE